jgi:hypothetical protein
MKSDQTSRGQSAPGIVRYVALVASERVGLDRMMGVK